MPHLRTRRRRSPAPKRAKQQTAESKPAAEAAAPKDKPHAAEGSVHQAGAEAARAEAREPDAHSAARPLGKPPTYLAANRARPCPRARSRAPGRGRGERRKHSPRSTGATKARARPRNGASSTPSTRPVRSASASRRSTSATAPGSSSSRSASTTSPRRCAWSTTATRCRSTTPRAAASWWPGERFELKQFHFHKPAEERIEGRAYDMVAHLVHQSRGRAPGGGDGAVRGGRSAQRLRRRRCGRTCRSSPSARSRRWR